MQINHLTIGGNLVRDPDLKYTPKGTAVCTISIANNRVWFNDANEKMQATTFVEAKAWGRQAEMLAKHFYKGRPICIEGNLSQEEWEDRDTKKMRSKTMVLINRVHFCGDSQQGRERPGTTPAPRESTAPRQQSSAYKPNSALNSRPAPPHQQSGDEFGDGPITDGLDDDEIPF